MWPSTTVGDGGDERARVPLAHREAVEPELLGEHGVVDHSLEPLVHGRLISPVTGSGACGTMSSIWNFMTGLLLGRRDERDDRPRWSRSVVPSYSVRNTPRSWSSGTTLSTKSSRPPG